MDLLFKRYASPLILLDSYITINRFANLVSEIIDIHMKEENDTKLWELYLHHTFLEKSFNEFKEQVVKEPSKPMNEVELETTINNSKRILNDFIPQ